MSARRAHVERSYRLHSTRLEVASEDAAVADAVDRRLRSFRCDDPGPDALRLEYAVSDEPAPPPPSPARPVYETRHGEVTYDERTDSLHATLRGVSLRCDAGAGRTRIQTAAYEGEALYIAAHPLTTLSLMELLKRRSRYALHAGCVADADARGVLVAGPTGAGKSTLTIALARAGMRYLSDDIVFLDGDAVLGFDDAVGVTAASAELFPELAPLAATATGPGFPKHLVRPEELSGSGMLARCRPALLVFPEIVPGPSAILPLDPKEAWLRLVPDVLLTHAGDTQRHLAALAALLDSVRCRRLLFGNDVDAGARVVVRELRG